MNLTTVLSLASVAAPTAAIPSGLASFYRITDVGSRNATLRPNDVPFIAAAHHLILGQNFRLPTTVVEAMLLSASANVANSHNASLYKRAASYGSDSNVCQGSPDLVQPMDTNKTATTVANPGDRPFSRQESITLSGVLIGATLQLAGMGLAYHQNNHLAHLRGDVGPRDG